MKTWAEVVKELPVLAVRPEKLEYAYFRLITRKLGNGDVQRRVELENNPIGICAMMVDPFFEPDTDEFLRLLKPLGVSYDRRELYYVVRNKGLANLRVQFLFWLGFAWRDFEWRFLSSLGIWGLAEYELGARVSWADVKWPRKWFRRKA